MEYLFELYFMPLTRYAFIYIQNEDIAKDMVQEVFYNIWKNRKRLCIDRSLEAFIYTSVRNQCLNHLKHEEVHCQYCDSYRKIRNIEIEFYRSKTDEDLIKKETEVKIREAIGSLSEKTRIVFKKSRFEGKANKKIASELRISVKAVEKHITSAIKQIHTYLN